MDLHHLDDYRYPPVAVPVALFLDIYVKGMVILWLRRATFTTGGPDVVFDYKTMYENTLKIALNSTCMKDLNKNALPYVCLALF